MEEGYGAQGESDCAREGAGEDVELDGQKRARGVGEGEGQGGEPGGQGVGKLVNRLLYCYAICGVATLSGELARLQAARLGTRGTSRLSTLCMQSHAAQCTVLSSSVNRLSKKTKKVSLPEAIQWLLEGT